MKILWMSDSPTSPSGFGNVTRYVCAGLAQHGHQVSILGWQARGNPVQWQGCTLYPMGRADFGADVLLTYLQKIRPQVLVTLADVWWLTYISEPIITNFMRTAGIPWALYYPIDGDMGEGRLPPSWVHILQTVDLPIAMSQYGAEVTRTNDCKSAYIPHGVDLGIFHPPVDKEVIKSKMGYAGKFVMLSDARNQPRKLLPRTLEIFRRFALNKNDVLLHLHCDPDDPAANAAEYTYNLRSDIAFLQLSDKVRITDGMSIARGLSLDELAKIYQGADVHLLASWGEGFGLPNLQAASTGVIPMASDYTASRELVFGHGEAIRVKDFVPDQFGLLRALIDIDDAVDKLERLYRNRDLLRAKSEDSWRFAQQYDWTKIVRQWHDLLSQEVPKLHMRSRYPATVTRLTFGHDRVEGPATLRRVVNTVLPNFPEGASVTLMLLVRQLSIQMGSVWQRRAGME